MQESKKSALVPSIIIIIVLIIIVFVGFWMYAHQKSTVGKTSTSSANSQIAFDADLIMQYQKIPDSENSLAAFYAASSTVLSKNDQNFLTTYISNNPTNKLPPPGQAAKVLTSNQNLLKVFDANLDKQYQCSMIRDEICPLAIMRTTEFMAAARTFSYLDQGKYDAAQKSALDVVRLGQIIDAHADDDVTLLIGWVGQKIGYDQALMVQSRSKPALPQVYTDSEKSALISQLRREHKAVITSNYVLHSEAIDYLSSATYVPDDRSLMPADPDEVNALAERRRDIAANPKGWNPQETKKYYYDSAKIELSNVDLPCGAQLASSTIDVGYNPERPNDENSIGKQIYSTTYASLSSLNTRRCAIEADINKL